MPRSRATGYEPGVTLLTHSFILPHQNNIKTQNINEFETTKLRSETQKFECICGRSYDIYQSIQRHQRSCQQWKVHQEDRQHSLDTEEGINYY